MKETTMLPNLFLHCPHCNGMLPKDEHICPKCNITEQIVHLKTALEKSNLELESRVTQHTAELEDALMRLGELDKMKANFIANVSHEFRTPLSHLVGYLDLIRNRNLGPLTIDQEEVLTGMTQATKRLWTLIEDLLQFSAAATGNMTLNPRPFPIMEPVKTAVLNKKPQANERHILLKANIVPNLPLVHADKEKISWVLEQLLDNAIKFTPSNGQVAAYARKKGDEVQIDIIDTGIGIPKDRINELFCSFHQLENFSTRRYEGMGLGLTMAQKIIAAHGSEIKVRSRVGVGSRFAFKLPVHN